jgi:hypothetical protein
MFRAVRACVAMLLACLGLVLTTTAPAAAECTCRQGTLDRQVERADVIFIGTVDAVGAEGNTYTYDVTASRAYQGEPERTTQVVSVGGRKSCGLGELETGETYVFFATGTGAPYDADTCGGTAVSNPTRTGKIEDLLGEGTSVEPPPPPKAVLTTVEDSPPAGLARSAAPGAAVALIGLLGLVVVRRLARR